MTSADRVLAHPRVPQPRHAVGLAVMPGALGEQAEQLDRLLDRRRQAARQFGARDQQVDDVRGLQPVIVEPAIGGHRRHGLEDRRPLIAIDHAADLLALGQQEMIFDVEQPRGVVGALDRLAEPDEPGRLVAQHPVDRAFEPARLGLDRLDQVQRRGRAAGRRAARRTSARRG